MSTERTLSQALVMELLSVERECRTMMTTEAVLGRTWSATGDQVESEALAEAGRPSLREAVMLPLNARVFSNKSTMSIYCVRTGCKEISYIFTSARPLSLYSLNSFSLNIFLSYVSALCSWEQFRNYESASGEGSSSFQWMCGTPIP